jgi:hypothetical protein
VLNLGPHTYVLQRTLTMLLHSPRQMPGFMDSNLNDVECAGGEAHKMYCWHKSSLKVLLHKLKYVFSVILLEFEHNK